MTKPTNLVTVDQAEAEVTRLSKKRIALLREGADLDRGALDRLDAALTAAGERLGAADLAAKRAGMRMPFDVEKFCRQETRCSDLHQNVLNRSTESNEAHSHRNKLKAAIETFDASEDSRTLARKLERVGRGEKLNAEDLKIAREIADLRERLIAAEAQRTRAAAVLAEIKAKSAVESAILESWRTADSRPTWSGFNPRSSKSAVTRTAKLCPYMCSRPWAPMRLVATTEFLVRPAC